MVEEKDANDPFLDNKKIDLPNDLQVSVNSSTQQSMTKKENTDSGVLDSLLESSSSQRKGSWIWAVFGVFVIILLGVTIYFFLGRSNLNTGVVHFTFEPAGVNVLINGEFNKYSLSSLTIKLKAGTHNIQITKEGYLDLEREFNLEAKEDADMHIILEQIPDMELLVDESVTSIGLVKNGQAIAYVDKQGNFMAVEAIVQQEVATLFEGSFANIQEVVWSDGGVKAIVKLKGMPALKNMYDNREVRGRFIVLGERPVQGLSRSNGISTWFFDSTLQTAKGWQPVLLNESIRSVSFSPDGGRIIYFYETSDGEKSLIMAHPDGEEWERLITQINAVDPTLLWLKDDRLVLLIDDNDIADRLFDVVNKEFDEVMPDRIKDTVIDGSPDGSRILYWVDDNGSQKLAIWNIANGSREYIFDEPITSFVWQTDERIVITKNDNTLWYWNLDEHQRPVQFINAFGPISPQRLFYSWLSKRLFIIEESRILNLYV